MLHLRWLVWSGIAFAPLLSIRAAQNPAAIPEPRSHAWVVDLVGVVSSADTAALNALADGVHQRDGAELAVVVIDTTSDADSRQFATGLFNRWRLGQRGRDHGLLLFVALNDRAAEIVLGDGIDSDAEVAASERIMQDTIVPRFRAGQPADAIVAGAHACAAQFFGTKSVTNSSKPAALIDIERPTTTQATRPSSSPTPDGRGLWIVGVASAGVFGTVAWLVGRVVSRRRSRRCRQCSTMMLRLDETTDDAHLAAAERVEEKIGSVDYDVWQCPGCNAVEKVRYGRWFTSYSRCPQCGGVTKNSTQHTLRSATTLSTGLVEVHETCAHCSYQKTYTRTAPRVSSSSSSLSSGSGRSSSGGRSSGRGASGRW